ncbi:hypothetical protein OH492_21175 [Vibrio chagasii]|nr:hypothetical protein [Vibrio chagasii]
MKRWLVLPLRRARVLHLLEKPLILSMGLSTRCRKPNEAVDEDGNIIQVLKRFQRLLRMALKALASVEQKALQVLAA